MIAPRASFIEHFPRQRRAVDMDEQLCILEDTTRSLPDRRRAFCTIMRFRIFAHLTDSHRDRAAADRLQLMQLAVSDLNGMPERKKHGRKTLVVQATNESSSQFAEVQVKMARAYAAAETIYTWIE